MSGFFGIFNRKGKQVDKEIANIMFDGMSNWKPDEKGIWSKGSVAFGHAMLWNTPESKFEHFPIKQDTYVLVMDARIDNRKELAKELNLPSRPMEEIGDSEFVLSAYKKWGKECPKYLLGDFVFIIWDEQKQQLFCARDHIGIKLFYYYLSEDYFIFANDIETILLHPNIEINFDDNFVASFFSGEGVYPPKATFFKRIKKLSAASILIVSKEGVENRVYWKIEDSPSIRCDTFEEYVQKLRILFEDAVDVRLRTIFPVASHLSGGIDSSPIAVLAARKLKEKGDKLYAFNWINIPKSSDESEYEAWSFSRRIAENENIDHKEFSIGSDYIVKILEEHNIFTKGTMYSWKEYFVQDAVKKLGSRTVLSGWGGDELISHNGYSYTTGLANQGKVVQVIKYLFLEKKYFNYSWYRLTKYIILFLFPRKIVNYLRKSKMKDEDSTNYYDSYMNEKFLLFLKGYPDKKYPGALGVRNHQLALYNYGHLLTRVESWALSVYSKKFEYRYPLLDKRIVEYAIGVPEELFYLQKGKSRSLFKSAVTDLLPNDIIWASKPEEEKINKKLEKDFINVLKIMQYKYKYKYDELYSNKYLEYDKFKNYLNTVDFEKSESDELNNVGLAILFLNSIKKLSSNVV